ncbi:unnamed protein product [Cylindrotheca closterium]|uniref:Uncharacterized protein n=1 Tax=Cylindrotheca closterium TaxID=2856 RepID=A0AAD2FEU3_9STRA|nr:unnamed protein product [Cylindrotheca closterium]
MSTLSNGLCSPVDPSSGMSTLSNGLCSPADPSSKAQSKSKKRLASIPENPKGAKEHNLRPSPSVPMQFKLTPPKGRSNPYQCTAPLDATPPWKQVITSDAVHVITSTPTGTQEASVPADAVVASTLRGRTNEENGAEEHNSALTYRDTVASPPAPTVPLTTDVPSCCPLDCLSLSAHYIFNVSVVFDWQSIGLSNFNQVQTAYNTFHQFASSIWGKITSKVVLCFADRLWIVIHFPAIVCLQIQHQRSCSHLIAVAHKSCCKSGFKDIILELVLSCSIGASNSSIRFCLDCKILEPGNAI